MNMHKIGRRLAAIVAVVITLPLAIMLSMAFALTLVIAVGLHTWQRGRYPWFASMWSDTQHCVKRSCYDGGADDVIICDSAIEAKTTAVELNEFGQVFRSALHNAVDVWLS